MRLYDSGARGGATRDYAPLIDDDGRPASVKTEPCGRLCAACGARLSIYNHDRSRLCAQCGVRGQRPLRPEDIQALFDAVARALTAPWDSAEPNEGETP